MHVPAELVSNIRLGNTILFVGAGISKNLDLPTFDDLVDHLGGELNFDPRIFRQLADQTVLAEFFKITQGSLGPLRSWMDRNWHRDEIRIADSKIHETIVRLNFPLVYTTNYDRWLEKSFEHWGKKYVKVASLGDLARVRKGETEIVKFHGDFDDDNSIVLTESDFFRRLSFEDPLDLKLRADSLNRGILFIGYSLKDINIRYLLFKLQKCWDSFGGSTTRPMSYIFLTHPNEIAEAVLRSRGIDPIVSDTDDSKRGIEDFLNYLLSEISTSTLAQ